MRKVMATDVEMEIETDTEMVREMVASILAIRLRRHRRRQHRVSGLAQVEKKMAKFRHPRLPCKVRQTK